VRSPIITPTRGQQQQWLTDFISSRAVPTDHQLL